MGVLNREGREIHAKIVFYGPHAGGMTANLKVIHRKLKREHRGELKSTPVPGPDGDAYEYLPITLGTVRGYKTSIQIYTVPGGAAHAQLRRELLEGVDGIVFVADLRPKRHDATIKAAEELGKHIESLGLSFDDIVLVTQFNRRDQADENALDGLHKRLPLEPAASFEAVASEGTGVLQTLTSLSKLILSNIRAAADAEAAEEDEQKPDGDGAQPIELRLADAGDLETRDGEVRVPLELVDASGRKFLLKLRLSLGSD